MKTQAIYNTRGYYYSITQCALGIIVIVDTFI